MISTYKQFFWCICMLSCFVITKPTPIKKLEDLNKCLRNLSGKLINPGSPEYESEIQEENVRIPFNPSVIAYVSNAQDVQTAVNCANNLKVGITAKSGGHSYENDGYGGRDGVLVVDVHNLNQITIDKEKKTAIIGSGNRIGPIYYALSQAGFLIPAGTCPSVGIAGHALGGGYGFSGRKFGTVSDNILSIEMVNAAGELITVNDNQNADLFFALRGAGGGNYGIVTSFTFNLNPTTPKVTSLTFQYDISKAGDVFKAVREYGLSLPDEVTFSVVFGANEITLEGVYQGAKTDAQTVMNQFIQLSQPSSKSFDEETFFESVVRWGFQSRDGTINPIHSPGNFKGKSFFVKYPGLSSDGIQSLQKFLTGLSSECSTIAIFDLYGGAVSRIPSNATAFVHRDNILYLIQLYTTLSGDQSTNNLCVEQLNSFGTSFQKKFTDYSSYQNYIDRDLQDWQKRYYGENFAKLVDVKKKYDPSNLFNFPQSIPTTI